jgi:hypothetical protein
MHMQFVCAYPSVQITIKAPKQGLVHHKNQCAFARGFFLEHTCAHHEKGLGKPTLIRCSESLPTEKLWATDQYVQELAHLLASTSSEAAGKVRHHSLFAYSHDAT